MGNGEGKLLWTVPSPQVLLLEVSGASLCLADPERCPGNVPTFSAIMLFLNSLLFSFFLPVFVFLSSLPFFVLSPHVWSPGSSAKKQGEDLADNDGDEDEGICVRQVAAAA